MIKKENKNLARKSRVSRVRTKVSGTATAPRLNVYRSLSNIYAQLIDDVNGVTLASASTLDKDVVAKIEGKNKKEAAFVVGEKIAACAKKKGIKKAVFDRAGYLYTGRVQSLADGARKAGLEF